MIITGVVFGIFYFRMSREQSIEVGGILSWLYVILLVCVAAVVVFSSLNIVQRWKNDRRSLLPFLAGIVSMLAVVGLAFFLSKRMSNGEGDVYSLIADISIYSLYILLGLTCVAVLAGIIWSYMKRTR